MTRSAIHFLLLTLWFLSGITGAAWGRGGFISPDQFGQSSDSTQGKAYSDFAGLNPNSSGYKELGAVFQSQLNWRFFKDSSATATKEALVALGLEVATAGFGHLFRGAKLWTTGARFEGSATRAEWASGNAASVSFPKGAKKYSWEWDEYGVYPKWNMDEAMIRIFWQSCGG